LLSGFQPELFPATRIWIFVFIYKLFIEIGLLITGPRLPAWTFFLFKFMIIL